MNEYIPDAFDMTPERALPELEKYIHEEKPTKMFAILLWDGEADFQTGFINGGMSKPEAIAALEIIKARLVKEIAGI